MDDLDVRGSSVFPGYLNREVLNRELFEKTGDLLRVDTTGSLHFVGRRDLILVKLREQRLQFNEIEQTIVNASADVARCLVIKQQSPVEGEESLVTFVQTTTMDIVEPILRHECEERLPSDIISARFLLLDRLPLSENEKVDRRRLSELENAVHEDGEEPTTALERRVDDLCCEMLRLETIPSTQISLFTLGENSLFF